ncbi:DUF3500 domain-containing protein [Fibrella aquatica]|uniref:DUF3500 domain-containing protein n=1 Tax=Fibrella aquatica TaxID=3242487 RepID=UPI0035215B2A
MHSSFVKATLLLLLSLVVGYACKSTDNTTVTPTTSATVSALTCGSTTFSATAVSGVAYTGTATVPYTGGNSAAYTAGTAIASTGVTGLNATLQAGTLANGAGNLVYAISGTPGGAGTAQFALSFGGQTCNLAFTVSSPGSTTTPVTTNCTSVTGVARVVCLAEAFKATLTAAQLATVQLAYSKTDATKWSNLPDGLYNGRVGIKLSALTATQLTAFYNLMGAVLTQNVANEGLDELEGGLVADDYLGANGGGTTYSRGNFHLAFLGTPSTTGLWELQFGGHHYTFANTYNAGKLTGTTPSFRAIEPMAAVTANGKTYQPMEQERVAFANLLSGLSAAEQTTAKLTSTFTDILLGPGKDGQFPSTRVGLKVGDLSAAKKTLVLNAIQLYVNDLDSESAATVMAKYTAELDNTYIGYAGTTTVTAQNDYIRIDGPSVWIEFSYQGGIVIRGVPHPHSVWRDRTGDYGGN